MRFAPHHVRCSRCPAGDFGKPKPLGFGMGGEVRRAHLNPIKLVGFKRVVYFCRMSNVNSVILVDLASKKNNRNFKIASLFEFEFFYQKQ